MALWFILALMTAAAVFAVLWPLSRHTALRPSGSDVAVYRDQLDELDRDRKSGLIGAPEAEAARVELARRLLAAADAGTDAAPAAPSQARRRIAMAMALLLLPAGTIALYTALGSPRLPGMPLAARLAAPPEARPIVALVAQVEAHLERNPEDGRGWDVVAPVYMRLGRFDDAVKARRNVLRLNGATATREADLGESLVAAAKGVVTAEAKSVFRRALALDREEFRASYFLGLAAEQDGRPQEAATIWRDLIARAPPTAPWLELVRGALARVETPAPAAPAAPSAEAPGPSQEDMAAASQLTPAQRNEMVRGMVDRLASRLQQDGSDVDGWVRLLRAYQVLGEPDRAKATAEEARRALAGQPEKLQRVEETVKALGLEG